jgi:hypothetical protein
MAGESGPPRPAIAFYPWSSSLGDRPATKALPQSQTSRQQCLRPNQGPIFSSVGRRHARQPPCRLPRRQSGISFVHCSLFPPFNRLAPDIVSREEFCKEVDITVQSPRSEVRHPTTGAVATVDRWSTFGGGLAIRSSRPSAEGSHARSIFSISRNISRSGSSALDGR